MKTLIWNRITSLVLVYLVVPIIVKGERCFEDTNCNSNEFCGKDPYGVFTICLPCIDCRDYYKMESQKMTACVRSILQCSDCLDGYEIAFDGGGGVLPHCVETSRPKVDAGLLSNDTNPDDFNLTAGLNSSKENNVGTSKSAGLIAGGVAIGVVAIAAIAFGAIFGFKYFKEKKRMNDKSAELERTTELQELHPKPVEIHNINETKTPEEIAKNQNL